MAQHNQSDFDEQAGHLGQSLDDLIFPADKRQIVSFARSNGLNSEMISVIEDLPDRQYQDLRDVLAHFMGGTDRTETHVESSANPLA